MRPRQPEQDELEGITRNLMSTKKTSNAGPRRPTTQPFSWMITDGVERAAGRAMLHAVGFNDGDFRKSQIGIASTWGMVTPCNMHINRLADEACAGVDEAGGKGTIFNTITISDGISMGTEGMKYSLVSREVIADSIETVDGSRSEAAI
jgi:dihydroxy-acid dehydratase